MSHHNLNSEFVRNGAIEHSDIVDLQKSVGIKLPTDYVDFMQATNGGEGPVGTCGYARIWRLNELLKWNKAYQVADRAPGLFLFGTDGGGEAFAFDTRQSPMPIVKVTFISMSHDDIIHMAHDFKSFLDVLGRGEH